MNIKDEIDLIVEELLLFEDVMDKYEYIIDMGKNSQALEEKYKTDSYLVQGCQSKVWLHIYEKNSLVYIEADSEAFIVKGLVQILIRIFSKKSAKEILKSSISDLEVFGFSEIISQGRQNGLNAMLKHIYSFAKGISNG